MVDIALYDFAEAALGHNPQMQWSLNESIVHRQVEPVFARCGSGELTAEEGLDACVDTFSTRLANMADIFYGLFGILCHKLGDTRNDLPALARMEEFFMGLNSDIDWSTSEDILRQEMRPVFVRCAEGTLKPKRAATILCDNMVAKRDFYLSTLQGLTRELAIERSKLPTDVATPAKGTQ